jgi:hypothetical protein
VPANAVLSRGGPLLSAFSGVVGSRTSGVTVSPRVRPEARIAAATSGWHSGAVYNATEIRWATAEAERAFGKAVRARRRASLVRRLLRRCAECARLAIHEARNARRAAAVHGVRDIPLDAITGSLEPHRAAQFDREFRPSAPTRRRWVAIWLAEQRGAALPPISVARIGEAYAIRDGHHRVSVARARGALSITAIVA